MTTHTLTIQKLVSGGLGLARDEAGVIFVEGVLPQEELTTTAPKKIHGVRHAQPAVWLRYSPRRRAPPCPLHEICGGCGFQYTDEASQRELKKSWILESLKRLGGWETDRIDVVSSQDWGYRHRAQLHWDGKNVGFLAPRSKNLVEATHCPVLAPALNTLLNPKLSFWLSRPPGRYVVSTNGTEVWGPDHTEAWVELNGLRLYYHPQGFLQAHLPLTEKLQAWLVQTLSKDPHPELWDLFGGVGTWSQLFAHAGWSVVLVESDERLQKFALRNCPNAVWAGQRVEDFLAQKSQPPSWVVVDPPRSGLSDSALSHLVRLRVSRLVYISCDADTFARDVKLLRRAGWINTYLGFWDFYPQTPHVELVSTWQLD